MADLRLVGVHEDGEHLLLSGTDGEIFLLPIDEALRLATIRSPRRTSQSGSSGTRLSPREIQSQIRSGASAADVAEHSGLTLEQVRRYEGPVLAERDHIAQLARKVEVAGATPGSDGYRSVFGDTPVSLEEMVTHRLGAFGIDPASLRWDAWRVHDGSWTVTADFEPGTDWAANSIGEPPPARWTFHTGRKSLFNANRWAQQLSELEPVDGPVPERRLTAVADRPFDFEADAPVVEAVEDADGVSANPGESPGDYPGTGLLDMLRSRRGQRLGLDEDGDDELAAMLGTPLPAEADDDVAGDPGDAARDNTPAAAGHEDAAAAAHGKKRLRSLPFLSLAPSLHGHVEPPLVGVGEVSTDTREITLSGAPSLRHAAQEHGVDTSVSEHGAVDSSFAQPRPTVADAATDGPSDSEVAARLERKATAKPKRSSVPSWDEIVFGTKGD